MRVTGAVLVGGAVLSGCAVSMPAAIPGDGTSATSAAHAATDDRPVVLTTFTVLADMARAVAGDHLRIESITKVGAEIHGYEPTPDDLRRATSADLVLDNGLGLEAWFEPFVARLDAPHVTVSEGVDTIPIAAGAYEGRANPHAWMSPSAGLVYVRNIADAFGALDPAHAGDYRANSGAYSAELRAVRDELAARLTVLPRAQRALVTCEGAFSYLARDLDLAQAFLWPVNADQQGTPQQVARTITFVQDNAVPAVFCESTVSATAQHQVARETGAAFGGVLYVDSLSLPDGPVPSYLDLLRYDAATVADALTGGRR